MPIVLDLSQLSPSGGFAQCDTIWRRTSAGTPAVKQSE
jgi:hypothetical protein